ncbi:MAG: 3-isopropylmalate dehydrogenase, partial [Nitrospinae bacterium]|nr:3-isopropylmalate dehydrogenase [Nitrospinota bacterium]
MADYKIGVIPGDGIGQEVTAHARKVLDVAGVRFGVSFEFREGVAGGTAYDAAGDPFPSETQELCADSDACLFGAVGGPQWDALPREKRPEAAILGLRQKFGLFANLRPAAMFEPLVDASTLKAEAVRGLDLLVVREGVGGIYFGGPRITEQVNPDEERAVDTMVYSTSEIRRIVRVGFEMASVRRKKLLSVDKENVLETSRLWRRVAGE